MKFIAAVAFFIFTSFSAWAGDPIGKSSVSGVIVEKGTGELLSGVRVEVPGTDYFTYTDESGEFILDVPQENVQIQVLLVSFERMTLDAEALNAQEKLHVELSPL